MYQEGSSVVLKKTSDTGWSIKGSVVVAEGPVVGKLLLHVDYVKIHCYCPAIEVSVKPASSSQVTAKRAILNLTGTVPALDRIEDMSTSSQKTVKLMYSVGTYGLSAYIVFFNVILFSVV